VGVSQFEVLLQDKWFMQSFDFQVVLDCPLEIVFPIYVDIERWCNRNIFGEIRWIQGEPWKEGSRLSIETRSPLRTKVDQVVQHFTPYESVSYLSHVLGITCETRVYFSRVPPSRTAVNVGMQMVGTLSRSLGFAIEPVIAKTTKGFFEELRKECEAAAREAKGPEGGESKI
jgi:hypothetical protein